MHRLNSLISIALVFVLFLIDAHNVFIEKTSIHGLFLSFYFLIWLVVLILLRFLNVDFLCAGSLLLPVKLSPLFFLVWVHLLFCFIVNTFLFLLGHPKFPYLDFILFILNSLPFIPFVLWQKSNQKTL